MRIVGARIVLFVAMGLLSSAASAGSLQEAMEPLVNDVSGRLPKPKSGKIIALLAPPVSKDAASQEAHEAVLKALLKVPSLKVTDKAALQATLKEAALGSEPSEQVLAEVAAAMGAQVLLVASVENVGSDRFVSLRAVETTSGRVLASGRAIVGSDSTAPSAEGRSLDVQLRRLGDELARAVEALPGEARYQRFAVLPFEDVGAETQEKQLGLLVSSQLTTLLQREHNLLVIERSQLARILDEAALGQTGLTDPQKTVSVGQLAGAQGLVIGTVSLAGDRYLVDARVVSVADGTVVASTQVPLPAADLVSLASDAVELRTRAGAVYRSVLMPGWGQLYNRQTEKAAAFAISEAAAIGVAVFFQLRGASYQRDYDNLSAGTPADEFKRLHNAAESAYSNRNTALYVLIGLHTLNILDALIFGKTYESANVGSGSAASLAPVGGF